MAHNIYRLASTILNKPQLITQEAFEPIAQYLTNRITDPSFIITDKPKVEKDDEDEDEDDVIVLGDIGVVQIQGSLSYRPVYTLCGKVGMSYVEIIDQVEKLAELGVKTIVFEFDSPGGQASHLFESTKVVRDILDEYGIKSVAYIDEYAASAAFAWAVVADEVIIHPSASAGSVGCVVCLLDQSKAMEKEGYKPIYIVSTTGKVPFNPDGSFSEKFLSRIQEDVTRLGDEFIAHVAKYTGMSVEDISATDAQMFHAEKAVELGFANKVMTHKEFNEYLSTIINQ